MKYGRHLRLSDGAKLVIGRNKEENEPLQQIDNPKYIHIKTVGIPGPHSLLRNTATQADRLLAARIILTYTKADPQKRYILDFDGTEVEASPFSSRDAIKPYMIL
jgi:tRNA-specific 2-thiouridylase